MAGKLKTSWKTRVAYVWEKSHTIIFLIVHPSGELLLINNDEPGAARWDRAIIMWDEDRQTYCMCKYNLNGKKFELPGMRANEAKELAVDLGIEYQSRERGDSITRRYLDNPLGRNLLRWAELHPRMAKDNPTVEHYKSVMLEDGTLPIEQALYSGF